MPHEVAADPRQLELIVVHLRDDLRLEDLIELGELLCE
jgi:hypothetical protein